MTGLPRYDTSSDDTRPSFTDYWKRSKEEATTKNITFVPSNLQQDQIHDDNGARAEASAQSKAQARRTQVRKAQIQHRQRKANYTKQLEMDIAKLREMIEQTENDCHMLQSENESIRHRLANSTGAYNTSSDLEQLDPAMFTTSSLPVPAPEYTASLSMSELMNTPAFQITRASSSPSSEGSYRPFAMPAHDDDNLLASITDASSARTAAYGCSVSMPAAPAALELSRDVLSGVETDEAINFILALEHICWNHFHPSFFTHADHDATATEHGHALMASAIALQSAPDEVFARIDAAEARLRTHPHEDPFVAQPAATNSTNTTTNTDTDTTPISWSTTSGGGGGGGSLTLQNLHGLAAALNPPDREVAPVQAWFEIAAAYGLGTARDGARMARVASELAGVVKCLHFGAVIERGAFDSVLERVLGSPPLSELRVR
ncbi:hypothetical protein F4775DRAFT_434578 [Biscogniauxia sp. FL1348]|nr:hypothetical protein F4775DRAFT_434578 [Biscogniauxia sp. FL1348]